ncbi:TAXI family TRAP transporter solute-binding subunit [Alkalibacillus haloalkaliphilus]|uniref:TAXI family TRAP transporter solute-binding subunit n=1 Tax=Alkalibacillus haloalkaliphilus TaxID=94136 RepID=UPI002936730B|nr:TAXI family TRAP transporter solute-binding subunit [Alkalibacillus haloalkaliphilus]MDV2583333.1 TAXI family TRAP transporter solute-binding subunit [Alkalibacillus haloalkaliphilus]
MNKKFLSAFTLMLAVSLILAACGGDNGDQADTDGGDSEGLDTNIATIATGGSSGPYNIIATTLAEAYTDELGVNARTETTGASVENMNLLNRESVEMAFVMSDVLSQAVEGEQNFEDDSIDNVQQIATLYPNYVQVVTTADSGIETLDDLEGKRVAVGDQNSGVEVNARTLLEGHGITYDDINEDYLGYAEAADGIRTGQIDAAFLTSGLPNSSVLELAESVDLQIVTIEQNRVEEIAEDKEYFVSMEIPEGTYNNDEPIETAAIMNALVVRSDLSEDDVYELTKTLFENLEQLENSHQAASDINLEDAQEGMVAPIHPGAQRYYDEQ